LAKINIILAIYSLFLLHPCVAQIKSKADKKMWLKADIAFDQNNYFEASQFYELLLEKAPDNEEIIYHLAICYFHLKIKPTLTYTYFEKINRNRFIEAHYYLAILNHKKQRYEEAINLLHKYQQTPVPKEISADRIIELIQVCNNAINYENSPNANVKILNLGDVVNSPQNDYAPIVNGKENELYFTSRRFHENYPLKDKYGQYYEKIYHTHLINNQWQNPIILDSIINNEAHNAATSITPDANKMLFYRTNMESSVGHIYESEKINNLWTRPIPLNTNVNSLWYSEPSACYAESDDVIFFSSNRPGGFGGKDLYYVKKLPNGQWGQPFNLGATINTRHNEDAPFVQSINNTLFFSSEGHNTMGGYDIFKSTFTESGEFSIPENLYYPINTCDDDIFFVSNYNNSIGYFSSNRVGGFGGQDIYTVHLDYLKTLYTIYYIRIVDKNGQIIPKAELTIYDKNTKAKIGQYLANEKLGRMILLVQPDIEYEIQIIADDYQSLQTAIQFKDEKNQLITLQSLSDE
jgi:hypothetical protein